MNNSVSVCLRQGACLCRPNEMAACQHLGHSIPPSIAKPVEPTTVQETLDQRGSRYGRWQDNSGYAQQLIDIFNEAQYRRVVAGMDTIQPIHMNALNMIAQKISRILSGDAEYEDNWIDIAGYAELARNPR